MSEVVLHASMSVDGFATGPEEDLTVLHGWAFGDPTMEMHPRVSEESSQLGR